MRITRFYSAALLFFLTPAALADTLHPLCLDSFAELGKNSIMTSLDLRACQKKYEHLHVEQKSPWLVSFNAASRVTDSEEDILPAFAAYNIIGQMENEQVLVNYAVNYGGSGTFTFGFLFKGLDLDNYPRLDDALAGKKRSANLELVQRFNGGDRCLGGITDMRIEAPDKISITRNMTPYELVVLGINKKKQEKSYGDLPDCALCCIGESTEIIDLNGQSELIEIRLNGSRMEQGKDRSKQQTCLSGLVSAEGKNLVLSRKELENLQANYVKKCMKANERPRQPRATRLPVQPEEPLF